MAPDITIVLDCCDPEGLSAFWADALGYVFRDMAAQYAVLTPPDGEAGPTLLLQQVGEDKTVKNRMHLDIATDDLEAAASRLETLGGRRLGTGELGDHRWITMGDPEGNEFDLAKVG